MYSLRTLQNHADFTINSPMYPMKNLQEKSSTATATASSTSPVTNNLPSKHCNDKQADSDTKVVKLTNLYSLQDEILMQLRGLKEQLSSLRFELSNKGSDPEILNEVTESDYSQSVFTTPFNDTPVSTYDIVINASPEYPPYSLLAIDKWWNGMISTKITPYVHSSVKHLPEHLNAFKKTESQSGSKIVVNIMLIWKKVDIDCELILSPLKQTAIRGEVNFLKFFNRIVNQTLEITEDLLQEMVLDSILDTCHQFSHSRSTKERAELLNILGAYINKKQSSSSNNFTLVDLALWSIISRNVKQSLPSNLKEWYERISNYVNIRF